MPSASHPQAQFVPISPDFDLHALVENTSNFDYVTRLSTEKLKEHSIQSFEALILAVVIQSGKPLVIEGWGETLPPWLFSPAWLQENLGTKPEQVRDISNQVNIPMTMGHYLRSMETLTNKVTPTTYRDSKRQRLYMKDIDCPDAWFGHLKDIMPECVFYLNDCIEPRSGGDGAVREPNEYGQMVYGKGVALAGDLMSSLPPDMRALNMMCYIGHEGTYTPAHREMCASLGHNIMVEASENRSGEKAGSSIWFMTETKEREVVSEYFLSMLGHDIEVEKHFAQVNAWKKAPFNVWVVEQRVGDLILIPPLAPHQVWNRGTRTMKAAWNRTTVDTLELALHEALPRARMVCREEQYKNKAIIYYTLLKYANLLKRDTVEPKMWQYGRIKQVIDDFKRLFALYGEILVSEMFSAKLPEEENVEFLEYDSNVTCSYCRCNIFNRFLTCKCCILYGPNGEEDTYDVCMDCYAMGRSCACISDLKWVEQWQWDTLVQNYDDWRAIVIQVDGHFDKHRSPQPLDIARKRYGRKPVAEVCQEQLRLRPWHDIAKPREPTPPSEEESEVDDEGRTKKKKKKATRGRKSGQVKDKTNSCHICCSHDWKWRLAFCTTCSLAYCYGTLWRAFDLMPQTVMEDKEWSCPRCLKMCSCGKCRKDSRQTPYAPKGTLLGHDTKKVADYRSVETLVDFSKTNLAWLRGENDADPQQSSRMMRLKEKAAAEKAREEPGSQNLMNGMESTQFGAGGADAEQIDPLLQDHSTVAGASDGEFEDEHHIYSGEQGNAHSHVNGKMTANTNDSSLSVGWSNHADNYDLYDADDCSPHATHVNYPMGLLGPREPEETHPDLLQSGSNRMMGAGFYQQGNGTDRILFNAPDEGGSDDEQRQQKKNSNLMLSDLLDPALQPVQEIKKRKRMGLDDIEAEEEFFTSKKQKQKQQKLVKERQLSIEHGVDNDIEPPIQPSQRQPPRRSAGKTSYEDLGEDAVPIEDDEGPTIIRTRDVNGLSSQSEGAGKERKSVDKTTPTIGSGKKRGRPRKSDTTQDKKVFERPVSNMINTPRKSAWLTRKAAEDGDDLSELPKRIRKPRVSAKESQANSLSVDKSSVFDESDSGLPGSDDDDDSLFGEPLMVNDSAVPSNHTQSRPSSSLRGSVAYVAEVNPKHFAESPAAPVARMLDTSPEQPVKRGRGRPPKSAKLAETSGAAALSEEIPKMLSLKERLALKGKAVKIVATRPKAPVGAMSKELAVEHSSPVLAESVEVPDNSLQSASPPVQRWSKFGEDKEEDDEELHPASPPPPSSASSASSQPVTTRKNDISPRTASKQPTVVRLMSPTPDEEDVIATARKFLSSDDDGSESDVSIPAVRVAPHSARRGRTVLRGFGGMPRGRGRGRPPVNRGV